MLVIAPAGRRHRRRDADAEQLAAASRRCPPLRDPVIGRRAPARPEVLREIAAVVGLPHRRRVRHRARPGSCCGGAIRPGRCPSSRAALSMIALGDVDRLGPAAAAIGRRGHRVGQHRRDLGVHRLECVGVDEAAHADRQRDRRPVGRIIGADRRHPARAQGEKLAVRSERQLRLDDAAARLLVALQPLAALGDPAHRPADRPPRPTAPARIRDSSRPSCRSRRPSCRTRRAAGGAARGRSGRPAPPGSGAPTAPCSGSCSGLRRGRMREAAARLHAVRGDPVDHDRVRARCARRARRRRRSPPCRRPRSVKASLPGLSSHTAGAPGASAASAR